MEVRLHTNTGITLNTLNARSECFRELIVSGIDIPLLFKLTFRRRCALLGNAAGFLAGLLIRLLLLLLLLVGFWRIVSERSLATYFANALAGRVDESAVDARPLLGRTPTNS